MRPLLRLLALVAIGTAGCNPNTPAGPDLTDPHEILGRTVETTAGLRSMRIRVDVETRDSSHPGVVQGGFAEGAIDLGAGEMSLTGQANDGSGAFGYIVADNASFVRSSANGRWTKVPGVGGMAVFMLIGGGGGPQPDVPRVLADLLDDAETTVELHGIEDCATGRCYVTRVGLTPAQVWKLVVGLTGLDQMRGGMAVQQPPDGIPPLTLEVLTDRSSLRLVQMSGGASLGFNTVAFRLQVASPDEPVSISAPPPNLVDDMGQGGFGIGGSTVPIDPGPAPAATQPAGTIAP